MSNLLAAVGRAQLERLDEKVEKKRAINKFYRNALGNLPGIEFMPEAPYGKSNCWLTVILVSPEKFGADRETVRLVLEAENIESRPIWKPMHLQPVFKRCKIVGGTVSEDLFARGLCLPSGTQMTEEDLERVTKVIRNCCKPSQCFI
jgi:dTDP-4-amino-4,6-dideoxygalactose transaminase